MSCTYYRDRATPEIDESINARSAARYLGQGIHPCVAAIMAYEDATTGGTEAGPSNVLQFKRRVA